MKMLDEIISDKVWRDIYTQLRLKNESGMDKKVITKVWLSTFVKIKTETDKLRRLYE